MAGLSLNLLDQLTFYGSYHTNKWNQLIHFFFVPTILWSTLVWCAYTGPLVPLPAVPAPVPLSGLLVPSLAALVALAYSLFYICLSPVAGLSWTAFLGVPLFLGAQAFLQVPNAWLWALGAHVFSWYMQIHPGHALLEKRKPALLDSFFQSLALAPLFVWFELLFVLGLYPRLHQQLQQRVAANISEHRACTQPLISGQDAAPAAAPADAAAADATK